MSVQNLPITFPEFYVMQSEIFAIFASFDIQMTHLKKLFWFACALYSFIVHHDTMFRQVYLFVLLKFFKLESIIIFRGEC